MVYDGWNLPSQICYNIFLANLFSIFYNWRSTRIFSSSEYERETRSKWKTTLDEAAMFIWYGIAIARARKPYQIGFLFADNNSYFGAITVTERSSTAPISKVVSRVSDWCSSYPADSCSCRQEKLSVQHNVGLQLFFKLYHYISTLNSIKKAMYWPRLPE